MRIWTVLNIKLLVHSKRGDEKISGGVKDRVKSGAKLTSNEQLESLSVLLEGKKR